MDDTQGQSVAQGKTESEQTSLTARRSIRAVAGPPGNGKILSKQTSFAPGDYVPEAAAFPGQGAWKAVGLVIGLSLGGLVGVIIGRVLFGTTGPGSTGALAGMAIMYIAWQEIQNNLTRSRARVYYQKLAAAEPANADACVQAGLWIHQNVNTQQDIEKGNEYYRAALQRDPGHRDATIELAMSLSVSSGLHTPQYQAVVDLLDPWLADHVDLYGEALIADALKELGQHGEAAAHYRTVLKMNPASAKRSEIEQYLKEHTVQTPEEETPWPRWT